MGAKLVLEWRMGERGLISHWCYVPIPNAVAGPQCEFYNPNGICRLYGSIGYDYIYTDTSVRTEQMYENEIERVMNFVTAQSDQECAELILDMLCHYYFPACDLSQPHPQPVQVNHMLSHTCARAHTHTTGAGCRGVVYRCYNITTPLLVL